VLVAQLRRLFKLTDVDNSQELSWDEFTEQLHSRQMVEYFKAVDLSMTEAESLFRLLDTDNSGCIDIEEFVRGCLRLRGPARSVDLSAFVHAFHLHDERMQEFQSLTVSSMHRLFDTVGSLCDKAGVQVPRLAGAAGGRISLGKTNRPSVFAANPLAMGLSAIPQRPSSDFVAGESAKPRHSARTL
jgi:hypothetical protein